MSEPTPIAKQAAERIYETAVTVKARCTVQGFVAVAAPIIDEAIAKQQPSAPEKYKCAYCHKGANELQPPHYLERVNRKGDTPAIWLCTEHILHQ